MKPEIEKILSLCKEGPKKRKEIMNGIPKTTFHMLINEMIDQGYLVRRDGLYYISGKGAIDLKKVRTNQSPESDIVSTSSTGLQTVRIPAKNKTVYEKTLAYLKTRENKDNLYDFEVYLNNFKKELEKKGIGVSEIKELDLIIKKMDKKQIDLDSFLTIVKGIESTTYKQMIQDIKKYGKINKAILKRQANLGELARTEEKIRKIQENKANKLWEYNIDPEQFTKWKELEKVMKKSKVDMNDLSNIIPDLIEIRKLGFNTYNAKVIARQLKGKIFTFAARINRLVKNGEKLDDAIKRLENEKIQVEKELDELENEQTDMENYLETLAMEKNKKINDLEKNIKIVEEYKKTVESLSIDINALTNARDKQQKEFEELEKGLNLLKDEQTKLDEIIRGKTNINSELTKKNDELKQLNERLEKDNRSKIEQGKDVDKSIRMAKSLFDFLFTDKFITNRDLKAKMKELVDSCDGTKPDFREQRVKISEEVRRELVDYLNENLKTEVVAKHKYDDLLEVKKECKDTVENQKNRINALIKERDDILSKNKEYEKKINKLENKRNI